MFSFFRHFRMHFIMRSYILQYLTHDTLKMKIGRCMQYTCVLEMSIIIYDLLSDTVYTNHTEALSGHDFLCF